MKNCPMKYILNLVMKLLKINKNENIKLYNNK